MSMKGVQKSLAVICGAGILVMLSIQIILTLLFTWVISTERIGLDASIYMTGITQFLSYLVMCILIMKLSKNKPGVVSAMTTGVGLFLQIAVAVLFLDCTLSNLTLGLIPAVAAYGCGILLCKNNKKKHKRKIKSR